MNLFVGDNIGSFRPDHNPFPAVMALEVFINRFFFWDFLLDLRWFGGDRPSFPAIWARQGKELFIVAF